MSDNLYVAIWEDRHADAEPYVFSSADDAIAWARGKARECDWHGELDEELTGPMRSAGWLYYGQYSCEGDSLRVVECVVDAKLSERAEAIPAVSGDGPYSRGGLDRRNGPGAARPG